MKIPELTQRASLLPSRRRCWDGKCGLASGSTDLASLAGRAAVVRRAGLLPGDPSGRSQTGGSVV